tara:strand:+ start:3196 stop:3564 length:369 start_codon:yes stop_codon:yes gene_type:complete
MKNLIVAGSIIAALSVLLGAFGAHGLKTLLSLEYLAIFETAVRYQLYHALGLMLMGISGFHLPDNLIQLPSYFLIFGTVIFSGTLIILVLTDLKWLGAITPIGGLCLVIGWLLFAYNIYFRY